MTNLNTMTIGYYQISPINSNNMKIITRNSCVKLWLNLVFFNALQQTTYNLNIELIVCTKLPLVSCIIYQIKITCTLTVHKINVC